jgi:hypothetical protein
MNSTQKSRCYSKLEFVGSMKFHSKDQTKKTEEENAETRPVKKSNTKKTLRGG